MSSAKASVPDKRIAILNTTLTLLSERGLHNTPMSVVAKEAGVSAGIIYHYFANKDELITELYKEIKFKMLRTFLAGFDAEASYKERFLCVWNSILRYYLEHPKEVKFLEQYENSPYYDANLSAHYAEELQTFIAFFQKGIEEGVLKDLPIEILGDVSVSIAIALVKQHVRGVYQLTDEITAAVAEASWDAIRK